MGAGTIVMAEGNGAAVNGNGHGQADVATADVISGFTLPERDARGRIVQLSGTLSAILAAHDYPPPVAQLLAEGLTLTAMLGALLRGDDGDVTVQAQASGGPVSLLVCDYRSGALRGYVQHDPQAVAALGPAQGLEALFGSGYLAITLDQSASSERYQGIVPLEGASLAAACEHYFAQSEQIPTLIRIAAHDRGAAGWTARGFIVQHLPVGEVGRERLDARDMHPDWQHVQLLARTLSDAELLDAAVSANDLLWRLYNADEIRVLPPAALSRGCRCSAAHIRSVLSRFGDEELQAMRTAAGTIDVDCAFCSRVFAITL